MKFISNDDRNSSHAPKSQGNLGKVNPSASVIVLGTGLTQDKYGESQGGENYKAG